jgi:type II secretory pathway component PulM
MTPALQRSLAALPARQLNLLAIGIVAIAAALAWTLAIRAPLATLRLQQARVAALDASRPLAPAPALSAPGAPAQAPLAAPTPLDLIAAVSASARDAGLAVGAAAPGPERTIAGLRQQTLDIEASGSYGALVDWMAGIEKNQPTVGITRLSLRPAQEAGRRQAQLQLGIHAQVTP